MKNSTKKKGLLFKNNKVAHIFKKFMKSKFEESETSKNLNEYYRFNKPIKSYSDILIDEIKKPASPLTLEQDEKRNVDVTY